MSANIALGSQKKNSLEMSEDAASSQVTAANVMEKIMKKVHKKVSPRNKRVIPPGWVDLLKILPDFSLNDDIFEQLIFRETLMISRLDEERSPTPVGGLSLDIQTAKGGPYKEKNSQNFHHKSKKFLVHFSSEFEHEGKNGGSRITAWVDRNLQTLEEKRREYLKNGSNIEEQHVYVSTLDKCYYVRQNKQKDIQYSLDRAKDLICEGANFILMRYLAVVRYIGSFELTTVYINGDLCRNVYVCKGPFSAMVNNKRLDVCKIYRKIYEECGVLHMSATLLTLQGQLLKQEWYNCNYVFQINPLAVVTNEKPSGNVKIPLEKSFKTDLELMSRYLDSKCKSKKLIQIYLKDHAEVKDMISDYVQAILQLKPDNVLEFTAKHFLYYSPDVLPRTEYFEHDPNNQESYDNFWRYF